MKIFFAALFLALGMFLLSTVSAQSTSVDSIQNPDIFLHTIPMSPDAEQRLRNEELRHEIYERDRQDIRRRELFI